MIARPPGTINSQDRMQALVAKAACPLEKVYFYEVDIEAANILFKFQLTPSSMIKYDPSLDQLALINVNQINYRGEYSALGNTSMNLSVCGIGPSNGGTVAYLFENYWFAETFRRSLL